MEDLGLVIERLAALQKAVQKPKAGRAPQETPQAQATYLTEVLTILNNYGQHIDVVLPCLRCLEDALVSVPQTATIIRLEGGAKLLPRLMRTYAPDVPVLAPLARVLCRCASSAAMQQLLLKEKGIGAMLLATAATHAKEPAIIAPLADLIMNLSRHAKGAAQLAGDGMVSLTKELLVNFLGNWTIFGLIIKALKNQAKHEAAALALMRANGEVLRLLLGVARLLVRLPEQRKLLKRTSRTVWLLSRSILVPLPDLEPLVTLPPKDAPHLSMLSAVEADPTRYMELFPEEFLSRVPGDSASGNSSGHAASTGQEQVPQQQGVGGDVPGYFQPQTANQQAAVAAPAHTIGPADPRPTRPQRQPTLIPPTASLMSAHVSAGGYKGSEPFHSSPPSTDIDMMIHDLRRVVHPESLLNRVVYTNMPDAAPPIPAPTGHPAVLGSSISLSRLTLGDPYYQSQVTQRAPDRDGTLFGDSLISSLARSGQTLGPPPTPLPHLARNGSLARPSSVAGGSRAAARNMPSIQPLSFESNFEGGNLRCAVQVYETEYDLFMTPDLNDRSEGGNRCQWFYFAVSGMQPGVPYKFNICNFRKKVSLFMHGKQPLVCKALRAEQYQGLMGQGVLHNTMQVGSQASTSSSEGPLGRSSVIVPTTLPPNGSLSSLNLPRLPSAPPATGGSSGPPFMSHVRAMNHVSSAGPTTQSQQQQAASSPRSSEHQPAEALVKACAAGCWVRAGSAITYYPSPYRGRSSTLGAGPDGGGGKKGGAGAKKSQGTARKLARASSTNAGSGSTKGTTSSATAAASAATSVSKEAPGASGPDATGPGLYCATFTLVFETPGTYYIASCYPYSYTDLQEHLESLTSRLNMGATQSSPHPHADSALRGPSPTQQHRQHHLLHPADPCQPASGTAAGQEFGPGIGSSTGAEEGVQPSMVPAVLAGSVMARSLLCWTLAGARCDLITITDFNAPPEVVKQREVVCITARVHPGETCASWIMQGILEFLTSSAPQAAMLRSSFVFKCVPMLNPDGVVNGNYRCSLAGVDLNRTWEKPGRSLQPTIFHTKRLLQALAVGSAGRLALYIDIHGHSTKPDVFFFGCEPNMSGLPPSGSQPPGAPPSPGGLGPAPTAPGATPSPAGSVPGTPPYGAAGPQGGGGGQGTSGGLSAREAARLRVRMLPFIMSRLSPSFSMEKSNYRIMKAKLGAARVVVHRELGCAGAYTLEASLGGRLSVRQHFGVSSYIEQGALLCRGIAELAEVDDGPLLEDMAASLTLPPWNAA